MLIDVFNEVNKELGDLCFMWVINEDDIRAIMNDGIDFEMYDDILVSHNIHDYMLLDYLGKHCKRRCC